MQREERDENRCAEAETTGGKRLGGGDLPILATGHDSNGGCLAPNARSTMSGRMTVPGVAAGAPLSFRGERAEPVVVAFLRRWGITVLGVAVITPFVILSFFNHPAADDFDYARQTLSRGFWGAQAAWYRWWTGRFVNSAIMSVNPLVVRWTGGFKVLPLLLLLLLAGSLYFFVRELTRPAWTMRHTLEGAIVLLVLYLNGMPSVNEGLYWFSSASTYQIANAFFLILAALVARRYRAPGEPAGWRLTAAAVLSVLVIAGSNETSLVVLLFLLTILLLYRSYVERHLDKWAGLLLLVGAAAAIVVAAAPGNAGRISLEAGAHTHSVPNALVHSLDGVREIPAWAESLPLVLLAVLFVPAAAALARRRGSDAGIFRANPFLLLASTVAAMVVAYFPTEWSVEHGPLPRTLNVAYMFFLVAFFVILVSAMRHSRGGEPALSGYAVVLLSFALVVSMKSPEGNVRRAWSDVLSGNASNFDREVRLRYRSLAACQAPLCEVDPIASKPFTLFQSDIDPRPKQNEAIAYYFGKKAVRLRTRP